MIDGQDVSSNHGEVPQCLIMSILSLHLNV